MKNVTWLTGTVAAILGGIVIAAPIANADQTDDIFLQALTQGGISWANGSDQMMVTMGHAVCKDWSDGATQEQTVADVKKALGLSDSGTGYLVGAATQSYCPQYMSRTHS